LSDAPASPSEPADRRLKWRCRRGLKELDVLLERFLARGYDACTVEQKRAFAQLVELPDPQLAGYLLGDQVPEDPALAELAQAISPHRR
jgi:antitoxin CptB